MAARTLRPKHSEEIRAKIQTSVILDYLHKHIKGLHEMTPAQVRSAEILLKKSIPDLSAVQLSGPNGGDIPLAVTITHVKPERTGS